MPGEKRAADAYAAKMDPTAVKAAYLARAADMVSNFFSEDSTYTALDAQLTVLLGDSVAQGLPTPEADEIKDYRVFTRQIMRAILAHPMNVATAEFGALLAFWAARGLSMDWLYRIGSVIFEIPEPTMDHALLTHLAYADAAHTGFAPTPAGNPTASAPGDSTAEGSSGTPSKNDHKHAREAFGSAAGTVCQGNDARLSDARTPTTHGNDKHSFYGAAFPSGPGSGDIFYNTTYQEWFYFDGAQWVTVVARRLTLNQMSAMPNNNNGAQAVGPRQTSSQSVRVDSIDWCFYFAAQQTALVYWTFDLTREPAGVSLGSWQSPLTAANTWVGGRVTVATVVTAADIAILMSSTRTGSAGDFRGSVEVIYREIGI